MTDTDIEAAEKKRKLKKTIFALGLGGVAGFVGASLVMKLFDSGAFPDLGRSVEIAAVVGIVLFAISYLKFAYEGFRYHVITGFLALIPVLNLIALPTLWDRTYRMLIVGIIGLAIAAGSWFLGADKTFWSYWNRSHKQVVASRVISPGSNSNRAAPTAGTAPHK